MATKTTSFFLHFLSYYFLFLDPSHSFTDTILQGQHFKDSDQLISSNRIFKLGFFSPGSSRSRYLGIWYNTLDQNPVFIAKKNVVWIANRNLPISDASGVLAIDRLGKLEISYNRGRSSIVLSSVEATSNVSAILFDSGNFVLKETNLDGSEKQILWQSFDFPTDTLLPGMKLGLDEKNMRTWSLTSWINDNLPAQGTFSLTIGLGFDKTSQLVIWWKGSIYWTSGLWQNGHFEFVPRLSNEGNPNFSYISSDGGYYFVYLPSNNTKTHSLSSYKMDSSGSILEIGGIAPFGDCSYNSDPGCVELKMPKCRSLNYFFVEKKLFVSKEGEKLDKSLSHFDCQKKCLDNCSCVAYAYTSANKTICELWNQEMLFAEKNGEARSVHVLEGKKAKRWIWPVIIASGLTLLVALLLMQFFIQRRRRKVAEIEAEYKAEQEILLCVSEDNTIDSRRTRMMNKLKRDKKSHELNFFSFESIASATDNFSTTNKLGEGGFGQVYKGILQDGLQVAVKRLSTNSRQGIAEFRNEIALIAKLQHTNLVRLVGCCIQREEKILIYEFMANKSLDAFLFDPTQKNLLDWKKRVHIIEGISQGLLYLHKYSRLRIVHRDLKAGNILLDAEMNPKISDFGIATIFGRNESETKTRRVVGTHGYMAPEYAFRGIVSTKVDVFSYGVLLLEIVSSKKHNKTYGSDHPFNLIGIAWDLWSEGRGLELMDQTMNGSCPHNEVLRCIHIGLLCTQDQPADRPNMSDVVSMLTNETSNLPKPKQPAYFVDRFEEQQQIGEHDSENCSVNHVIITTMEAR